MRLHGNTITRPILERLWDRTIIDPVTGCHVWRGCRSKFGHGHIKIRGKLTMVHRAAWEALNGPIPDGIDCLHDCPGGDNPACWNAEHLWLGTQGDNNADCIAKGRQVVVRGEDIATARVTEEQVLAIRSDPRRYEEIAARYGITVWQVGNIMRANSWAHLPGARSRKRGDAHHAAKITEEIVRRIRADARSQRIVAEEFGLNQSSVSLIKRGLLWGHVA